MVAGTDADNANRPIMKQIAILGSGMAGFGAAHRLHAEGLASTMYEKKSYYGGHTASHLYPEGFLFDEGPHVSFTKDARIQQLLAENIDQAFETLTTRVNNHWKGHWIKHPAQCNLYGLPEDLVVNVLKDFIHAQHHDHGEIRNYADWLKASFGRTFAETFPMEYCLKYHTTTADNMSTDWLGPRLYRPDLEEVLRGAIAPATPDVHYIDHFRYPSRGGFVSYLKPLKGKTNLQLNHEVVRITPRHNTLHFSNGGSATFDHLISSIPLPDLIAMIEGCPRAVLEASQTLACSEVVLVNIGIDRPDIIDAHWTYIYDRDICFTRLSTPHMQSPNNAPPGCGSLQAECYFSRKYRPLDRTPEACIEPVIRDLRRCGLLRDDDRILFRNAMHVPYANIIFDLERTDAVKTVHGYLDDIGIRYCGRYGDWGYLWTDESFKSGERAAWATLALDDGTGVLP
jgi:protoporphyrinogen oxidase